MNQSIGQTNSNLVCFNHSLLVLDSTTYDAAVNSEFLSNFAFSHEKQMTGFKGFYLIGETNYIELFHPNSINGSIEEPGAIWICLASLKANYLKTLNQEKLDFLQFELDDQHSYLNLLINDSMNPITTREMRKDQFESWTKKEYHDSIEFLPVDYNSPAESDSSSNYLMNDVIGIGLTLSADDRLDVIRYFREIGFDSVSDFKGFERLSNEDQFIELHFTNEDILPSINRFYLQLNKPVPQHNEVIGNSRIECDGKLATWNFELGK